MKKIGLNVFLFSNNDPCVSYGPILSERENVPDFHRSSPKIAKLRLCRVTNESTEPHCPPLMLNHYMELR